MYSDEYGSLSIIVSGFTIFIFVLIIGYFIIFNTNNSNSFSLKDDVSDIIISDNDISVNVSDSFLIEAYVYNGDGDINWVSSDNNICTVNDGMVTGINSGECFVHAYLGDIKRSTRVIVLGDLINDNIVSDVKINSDSLINLDVGSNYIIDYVSDDVVYFYSNNSNICKVSNDGVITGVSKGICFVKAISSGFRYDFKVVVDDSDDSKYIAVSDAYMISPNKVSLRVGDETRMIIKSGPNFASNRKINYYVNSFSGCSVSDDGVIKVDRKIVDGKCFVFASVDFDRFNFIMEVNVE